jgi:hypothetical protein
MAEIRSIEDLRRIVHGTRIAEQLIGSTPPAPIPPASISPVEQCVKITDENATTDGFYKGVIVYRNTANIMSSVWLEAEEVRVVGLNDEVLEEGVYYKGVAAGVLEFGEGKGYALILVTVPDSSASCRNCAPSVITTGSASGSGEDDSPTYPDPDYFDPFTISDMRCVGGKLLVTRCRMQIVFDGTRYRNDLYDCVTTEEGCCECPDTGSDSGSGDDDVASCCTGEILTVVGFSMVGPLGSGGEIGTIIGDLDRFPPELTWGGTESDPVTGGTAITTFQVYCQSGLWYAAGTLKRPGHDTDTFSIALSDDGEFLSGTFSVDGWTDLVGLVVERPCDFGGTSSAAGGATCETATDLGGPPASWSGIIPTAAVYYWKVGVAPATGNYYLRLPYAFSSLVGWTLYVGTSCGTKVSTLTGLGNIGSYCNVFAVTAGDIIWMSFTNGDGTDLSTSWSVTSTPC